MAENKGKFVAYYRVSTQKQGKSGLGLEAQQDAVKTYLNGGSWKIVGEFTEVESGKREDNRPMLAAAFKACRAHRATLVIAKLDRLSRSAHFLLGLQQAGVEFVCVDDPHMTPLTLGIRAVVAQHEREMISQRTKAALAAAKRRGVQLGGDRGVVPSRKVRAMAIESKRERADERASDLKSIIEELREAGVKSQRAIAAALTEKGIPTSWGKTTWSETQVRRLLERMQA